jgi:hypothetical protein
MRCGTRRGKPAYESESKLSHSKFASGSIPLVVRL